MSGGAWIQLANGRAYSFDAPGAIPIDVVARSLARICRFTGHVERFYSVAQHSVLVSKLVEPRLAAHGLLHDAGESVVGDVATPLKRAISERDGGYLRSLEHRVHGAILAGLGLPALNAEDEAIVKAADSLALCIEVRDLMRAGERAIELDHGFAVVSHFPRIARTWDCAEGEERFLERWQEVRR
jgi:hypothetical protein